MPVPIDTSAPLSMVLLPAAVQQGRPLPLLHFTQPCFYGVLPGGIKHHSAQVKGSCLKGCLKDIRNIHEDDVPHEQAKEGGPDAPLCMSTCITMCHGRPSTTCSKQGLSLNSGHQVHATQVNILQTGLYKASNECTEHQTNVIFSLIGKPLH